MDNWDSEKYLLFKNERTQPAIDLCSRIIADSPQKVLDIGCGPGNSTAVLYRKFPNAAILGIDSSKDMIAAAKAEHPQMDFQICDASEDLESAGNDFDIVFSNACIQWVPNHPKLLSEMFGLLKPGGIIAVQTPMNYDEPIHKIIGKTASSEKWKPHFKDPRIFYNLTQGEYYDLLAEKSSNFTMWETTYIHKMKTHTDIMNWYRGTGLRPYLSALSDCDRILFENDIYHEVVKSYPRQKNGEIMFRFPRFFFIAKK